MSILDSSIPPNVFRPLITYRFIITKSTSVQCSLLKATKIPLILWMIVARRCVDKKIYIKIMRRTSNVKVEEEEKEEGGGEKKKNLNGEISYYYYY